MSQTIDRALRHLRHSRLLTAAKRSGDVAAQLEHSLHVADTRIGGKGPQRGRQPQSAGAMRDAIAARLAGGRSRLAAGSRDAVCARARLIPNYSAREGGRFDFLSNIVEKRYISQFLDFSQTFFKLFLVPTIAGCLL